MGLFIAFFITLSSGIIYLIWVEKGKKKVEKKEGVAENLGAKVNKEKLKEKSLEEEIPIKKE